MPRICYLHIANERVCALLKILRDKRWRGLQDESGWNGTLDADFLKKFAPGILNFFHVPHISADRKFATPIKLRLRVGS